MAIDDAGKDKTSDPLTENESTEVPPLPPPPLPSEMDSNVDGKENHVGDQQDPPLPPKGEHPLPPHLPPSTKRRSKIVEETWSTGRQCGFGFVFFLAQLFLFGSLGLVLFWVFNYRGGIAWQESVNEMFNLHPLLMVGGFVFLLGEAMLVYRGCRCCRKIYNKLWHTILHLLVMPAAAIGVVAVFDFHRLNTTPIPDLYSLHSWMGLGTLGLFGLQFIVGFFSFLVLLCCENSTARFRASLLPLHVHFGLATFLMAIACCVTGLTEKAIFSLRDKYSERNEEGLVINVLGIVLVVTGVLVTYVVRDQRYQRLSSTVIDERL